MKKNIKRYIITILLLFLSVIVYYLDNLGPIIYTVPEKEIEYNEYTLYTENRYRGIVYVEGKKEYITEETMLPNDLCPYDLIFIWENLKNENILSKSKYRQENRWFYYEIPKNIVESKEYIIQHSSNNHIIPANEKVRQKLINIQKGDTIYIESYLIDFKYNDRLIKSSKTLLDTGGTACEIHYVTNIKVLKSDE